MLYSLVMGHLGTFYRGGWLLYSFQSVVRILNHFWERHGCLITYPYDIEKGAGTFNPMTFFRVLGTQPWSCAYVEPCRRPTDGRYGINPNRLYRYFQYQVILKPQVDNVQQLYLQSIENIGIKLQEHDVRFVEDDWSSPTIGATGLGWEIWIDGVEVTQFTYFQNMGGIPLDVISVEITYGLERLCLFSQKKDNIFDIQWDNHHTYGDLYQDAEREFSKFNFELANIKLFFQQFSDELSECEQLIGENCIFPAYDCLLKASHIFNVLDSKNAFTGSDRAKFVFKIRKQANHIATKWVQQNR